MKFARKFIYFPLLSVIALFSCAHVVHSVGHDTNIGFCTDYISKYSIPLMTKVVHKQNNRWPKIFRKTDLTLRFPEHGEFSAPIKCIMIRDLESNGNGGFASVKSGGVNYRYVEIYFRTKRGGDINFNVGVHGDSPRSGPIYTPPNHQMGWNPPPPLPPQQQPQYGWRYPHAH